MPSTQKLRIGLLYGGRSPEHEVSCMSARGVLAQLDRTRYDVVPIGIDPRGRWYLQDLAALDRSDAAERPGLHIDTAGPELALQPRPGGPLLAGDRRLQLDLALPIMHGPLCEDGALQGLLELWDLPYVGPGVLSSALCMDKEVAKRIASAGGVACAPYLRVRRADWPALRADLAAAVLAGPGLPAFVKPANMGSSVGITRVADAAGLRAAVETALDYDDKVLIERAIDAREIELAVLSSSEAGGPPDVSLPGEITAAEAFYDYTRKYLDAGGAQLQIPAPLSQAEQAAAQAMAARVFALLECEGMARIDLFLDRVDGKLYFNEANTLPGFTPISMYPKMWARSGLPYPALLDRLIAHARTRHAARARLLRTRPESR